MGQGLGDEGLIVVSANTKPAANRADPVLTYAAVQIAYHANDGYRGTESIGGRGQDPKVAMLAALDELTRVLALFGFETEARAAAEGAFERVAAFRARVAARAAARAT